MRIKHSFVFLALWFLVAHPVLARQWADTTGRFSVEAELVRVQQGKVYLRTTDGKVISVPVDKLSAADQRFLKERTSAEESAAPNYSAEFEKLVAKIKERATRPVGVLEQMPESLAGGSFTDGKWIRSESEYTVKDYAIKESTTAPYEATIVVTRRISIYIDPKNDDRGVGGKMADRWFDSEAAATRATKRFYEDIPELQAADKHFFTVECVWKKNRWTPKDADRTLFFPYSEKLYELIAYKHVRGNTYIDESYKDRKPPVAKTYKVTRQPPNGLSETPDADPGLVDEFAAIALGPLSQTYRKRGFGDFEFGATPAQVEAIPLATALPASEGIQEFYYEGYRLIGYSRSYFGKMGPHLENLREIFGRAPDVNTTTATSTATLDGVTTTTVKARTTYYFPEVVVFMRPESKTHVWAAGRNVDEAVVLGVRDRAWLLRRMNQDMAEKRKVLEWVQQVLGHASRGQSHLRKMKTYPGTRLGKSVRQDIVSLTGARGQTFLSMTFPTADARDRQKATVVVSLYMESLPDRTPNEAYAALVPQSEKVRWNSLLAQEMFPPIGTQIAVSKLPDRFSKIYQWTTADGWAVTVSAQDVFRFRKIFPEEAPDAAAGHLPAP